MKFEWPVLLSHLCHPGRRPGIQFEPQPFAKNGNVQWIPAQGRDDKEKGPVFVFVIPGVDPGSSVDRYPLQRAAACNGSRLKAGMTTNKAGMTNNRAGMANNKAGMTKKAGRTKNEAERAIKGRDNQA